MATNLEPIVNNIVSNTTAKNIINNIDLDLIDPYKIADIDNREDRKANKADQKQKQNSNSNDRSN